VGRTNHLYLQRDIFYKPEEIFHAVREKVQRTLGKNKKIDYLSFVPEGEPTLDMNLGREIELLKMLGIKIAVFTNASLIWMDEVQKDLMDADWISLKVDTVDEQIWRKINRPNKSLNFESVINGMIQFASDFQGELVTETMLISGMNDGETHIEKVSKFLKDLNPSKVYLAVPIRPPAEKWVESPDKKTIGNAHKILSLNHLDVVSLTGPEDLDYTYTGNAEEGLLSILAVQPMRQNAVEAFLDHANTHWSLVYKLISQGKIYEVIYGGEKYYRKR
jgi:wyosine [tRNA(Phe)-imidazoG37] synthetase (radical SAM superfamily)